MLDVYANWPRVSRTRVSKNERGPPASQEGVLMRLACVGRRVLSLSRSLDFKKYSGSTAPRCRDIWRSAPATAVLTLLHVVRRSLYPLAPRPCRCIVVDGQFVSTVISTAATTALPTTSADYKHFEALDAGAAVFTIRGDGQVRSSSAPGYDPPPFGWSWGPFETQKEL